VELRDSESLISRSRANRTVGRRSLGGRLYLTDQRLVFEPHLIDRLVSRGRVLDVVLTNVAAVDVAPRGAGLFDGGLFRERLRVQLTDGADELFVVSSPNDLARGIAEAAKLR